MFKFGNYIFSRYTEVNFNINRIKKKNPSRLVRKKAKMYSPETIRASFGPTVCIFPMLPFLDSATGVDVIYSARFIDLIQKCVGGCVLSLNL